MAALSKVVPGNIILNYMKRKIRSFIDVWDDSYCW